MEKSSGRACFFILHHSRVGPRVCLQQLEESPFLGREGCGGCYKSRSALIGTQVACNSIWSLSLPYPRRADWPWKKAELSNTFSATLSPALYEYILASIVLILPAWDYALLSFYR